MKNLIKHKTKKITNKVTILTLFLLTILVSNSTYSQTGDNLGNHIATQTLNMNSKIVDNARHVNIKNIQEAGVRFWRSDNYKISMSRNSDYKYGPVQDYSIKCNMNNDPDRGWTWGIVNQTPVAALNTQGTMQLKKDLFVMGKLGIGTDNPSANLHIDGIGSSMQIGNGNSVLQIADSHCNGCYSGVAQTGDKVIRILGSNNLIFDSGGSVGSGRSFKFVSQWSNLMKIEDNGEVSIGSVSTPSGYKLYVEDGILTERVKVATVGSADWADYVFENDYDLNTAEEVESFVKENKHLPNVPSVKEVGENGVDMVKMDATLLRQIEELWLHVIELDKENDRLNAKLEALEVSK